MKKTIYFALILVLVASVSLFGAWSPTDEETEIRYADAPVLSTYATEKVSYTRKEVVDEYETPGGCPTYHNTNFSNACGPVAGAEIVAFYDKYYPELIPNWVSYYEASGKYRPQTSAYVQPLLEELYNLMSANVNGDGVSESEFTTGLKSYFTSHGRTLSLSSIKSGSTFNYTSCKSAINSNKVIVLFITPGDVYTLAYGSGFDNVSNYTISGNHIMVAYGYMKINYYNSSGLFRTDTYLKVATGFDSPSIMLYKLNAGNLQAGYITNVS